MQIRKFWKMMAIVLVTWVMVILGGQSAFCADVAKIGIVSFQKILENSEAGKAAKQELTTEGKAMEADLQKRGDAIKEIQQMLERDTGIMSKEAREEKQWELNRKIDDAKALKQKYDRKIQEIQLKLVSGIRHDLVSLIRDYGEKNGFLMVLEDVSVVYAPQSLEISDEIIKMYNEQYTRQGKQTQGPKQ